MNRIVKVINIEGTPIKDIELPKIFNEPYRPDIIKKSVLSSQSQRRHHYGPTLYAGMQTSARGWGSGRGASHVPRIVNGSRTARIPLAVGGRRAHPPKPEKIYIEKINKKERKLAIRSAIATTINEELVISRGHLFSTENFPLIIENDFELINKTKDVIECLKKIGVYEDIERAKYGKKIRPGRGKTRGRKYKNKKSILLITGEECSSIFKAAKNIPGVDICSINNLNTELLAPGTQAGRLSLWTESAIEKLINKENEE